MKFSYLLLGSLCILFFAVMPAQAFTAKTLTITLNGNGDAQVDMQYDLTFVEQAAIFFHVANPASELQNALQENLNEPVTVVRADSSSAEVIISSFAQVTQSGGITTMATPAFSFAHAEEVMKQYWFAPLISPDLTPQVTTITFPDGYQATFNDLISIPSVSHTVA
ncbi:hypothetical protein [Methanoregula sp.]|uniref:hypothetical protein n=1 Tax=Methanoregula sp. TaxID=2052170 RepID=UPI003BB1A15D